jgi:3',5'-cyclic AMP phosphodiesterase CpdA
VGSVRVTVVSDSHLSERTPEASANWRAAVDHIAAAPPDVVVHAGDISTDGARLPADLDFARRQLDLVERAGVPVLAIPGNHDVGDNPYGDETGQGEHHGEHHGEHDGEHDGVAPDGYPLVDPGRLARYRDVIGPDRWFADIGDWRLVGLDALVLGSGLPDEDEQWAWLSSAVSLPTTGPRHIALFLHKPVMDPPDRSDRNSAGRYVVPAARERLARVIAGSPARAVVTGHVHQFRRHAGEGLAHVWAPTTWAVLPDRIQPVLGAKACGIVELSLGADGTVDADLRRPAGLAHWVIADDIADPYET